MPTPTDRCANVLGIRINAFTLVNAVDSCERLLESGNKGYVCVTGVHGVMEAQSNSQLRALLNRSFLTVPDGMPMVWVGRIQGYRGMNRVYGPDLMVELCSRLVPRGVRHFLYGGNQGVAEELAKRLQQKIPGLEVVGTFTPPFRPLSEKEECRLELLVATCKPDVFWVGLSTPKQEMFMARYLERLDTKLMVGVGAAFDIHTGRIKDAPAWVKTTGLQWLHRLVQEPGRLWRRYLINNPRFLVRILLQLVGITNYVP